MKTAVMSSAVAMTVGGLVSLAAADWKAPRTPWGEPDLGGTWTSQAELGETFKEDNPTMQLPDVGDRFAAGAVVEDLKGIFEEAQITGGDSRNIIVVGDSDGHITVGGVQLNVQSWTGKATLDNGKSTGGDGLGLLHELYIVNFANVGGARVSVRDTGEGSGIDEIIVNGTDNADTVTLRLPSSTARARVKALTAPLLAA